MKFSTQLSSRRISFLILRAQIDNLLLKAYDAQFHAKKTTIDSIADALDVDRDVILDRLAGRCVMSIEDIADLAWALGYRLTVNIEELPNGKA